MCGIFGLFSTKPNEPITVPVRQIAQSVDLLAHRGPDILQLSFFTGDQSTPETVLTSAAKSVQGEFTGVFGHTRLSIIDRTERSHQPLRLKESDQFWIDYNGEVYNFKALRHGLKERGMEFASDGDTETVLAAYVDAGGDPKFLNNLNGMFAFAVLDQQKKQLFLARDRYGIKPLYYTTLPNGEFAFASEIKALLNLPDVKRTINPVALYDQLTFQNTFFDRTLVSDIHILEPGHYAILDLETGQFTKQQYWEPVFTDAGFDEKKYAQQADELYQALSQSIERQLMGEVNIGSFLSGGMDTGAITALAAQHKKDLHTFTCGFDVENVTGVESYFDERETARTLVDQFKTDHHEMTIGPEAMAQVLPQVVWYLDDFRAGISYQNFLVNELVSKHVTVVLSGVGGDELFAGYPWRYQPLMPIQNEDVFAERYYQSWIRLLNDDEKNNLLSQGVLTDLSGYRSVDGFNQMLNTCQATGPIHKALCFDMKTFLHGLLVVEDRLSMAHTVESRVPFLDNAVVDCCLNLPAATKLDHTGKAKLILKEALKPLLPTEVINRRKQGFTPPDATWYRGPNQDYIESVLLSSQALDRGLFEKSALKKILDSHFSGHQNHRFLIWSLLCLEWWQRLYVDQSTIAAPEPVVA